MARAHARAAAADGAYSIRVVAAETGISADILRMWERRYGFPTPLRRPGGSRVYGAKDVERLRLIARARDAGYRPRDLFDLPDEEIGRLAMFARGGRTGLGEASAATAPRPALEALMARIGGDDVAGVRSELHSWATALGPRRFVVDVAGPLATRVGDEWARGTIHVRHEHVVTGLLSTQLRILLGALADAERPPVIVLATLPGEHHMLGLEMVAVYLAARGASPRLVGPDTPPEQIAAAAVALSADAVGVSLVSTPSTGALEALRAATPSGTELWLGGAQAAGAGARIPGTLVFADWSELDAGLERLRQRRPASVTR